MITGNDSIEVLSDLGGLSNTSISYPLHFSFKDLCFEECIKLVSNLSNSYNIEVVKITKHRRGFNRC